MVNNLHKLLQDAINTIFAIENQEKGWASNSTKTVKTLRAALAEPEPVAWFDSTGKLHGRVSDEQLEALCRNALAVINKRNGWGEK